MLQELSKKDTPLSQKMGQGYSLAELIANKSIDPEPIQTYLTNRLKSASIKINSLDGLQLFKNKEHYTDISFNDNNISSLAQNDFKGFTEITSLDLNNNQINSIELGSFQEMPHLKEIKLSNNRLTYFDPRLIAGLSQLNLLDLSANRLSQENIKDIQSALPTGTHLVTE